MTQRIFDIENEKDMQDLWDILPEYYEKITKDCMYNLHKKYGGIDAYDSFGIFFKINWHNKKEITRPVYEITDQDIGKICCFWEEKQKIYGELHHIEKGILGAKIYFINNYDSYPNCRRLTKQEIEELC